MQNIKVKDQSVRKIEKSWTDRWMEAMQLSAVLISSVTFYIKLHSSHAF